MGIILVFAGEYGNGKPPNSTVDEFHLFRVQEYTILYEILYIFSSTFTKCSIAFTQVTFLPFPFAVVFKVQCHPHFESGHGANTE